MGVLDGKVAVITGSTRGIGLGIAEAYALEGAELVVSSRSKDAVDKTVKHLREAGSKVAGLACDVSQQDQVLALANFAMQNFGKVDIWFNNAGLETAYGPTMSYSTEDFTRVVQTNIMGAITVRVPPCSSSCPSAQANCSTWWGEAIKVQYPIRTPTGPPKHGCFPSPNHWRRSMPAAGLASSISARG